MAKLFDVAVRCSAIDDYLLGRRRAFPTGPKQGRSHTLAGDPDFRRILTVGWILYDHICKSKLAEHPSALMLLLFLILVAMSWGYNQIFTGRAALLHLGAFTATIMTANVFFQIMPNQRIVVADLKAGACRMPNMARLQKSAPPTTTTSPCRLFS